jgi:hypothetical protein
MNVAPLMSVDESGFPPRRLRQCGSNQAYTVIAVNSWNPGKTVAIPANHIDEDALELYTLGRLTDEGQFAAVQKHLVNCEACRERLRAENAFVRLLRAALRRG